MSPGKKEAHLRKCFQQTALWGTVVTDVDWSSPLWAVPGPCTKATWASQREQASKQRSSMVSSLSFSPSSVLAFLDDGEQPVSHRNPFLLQVVFWLWYISQQQKNTLEQFHCRVFILCFGWFSTHPAGPLPSTSLPPSLSVQWFICFTGGERLLEAPALLSSLELIYGRVMCLERKWRCFLWEVGAPGPHESEESSRSTLEKPWCEDSSPISPLQFLCVP